MSSRKQRARVTPFKETPVKSAEVSEGLLDDRYQFASLLTLLFSLLAASSTFGQTTTVLALAGAALALYRQRWFWPTFFVVALLKFFTGSIFSLDNHSWLFLYWVLTLAIYSLVLPSEKHFKLAARLLIAFSFVFATAWKVLSPEFRSGSFFTFAGAVESRFTGLFEMLGLQAHGTGNNNTYYLQQWIVSNPPTGFQLVNNAELHPFWIFLTFATIAVEASVAILFLIPLAQKRAWMRDALLAGFCVGTYILMPVIGFGHLLCILGYTQSSLDEKKRRYLYAGLMIFIQATMLRDSLASGVTGN